MNINIVSKQANKKTVILATNSVKTFSNVNFPDASKSKKMLLENYKTSDKKTKIIIRLLYNLIIMSSIIYGTWYAFKKEQLNIKIFHPEMQANFLKNFIKVLVYMLKICLWIAEKLPSDYFHTIFLTASSISMKGLKQIVFNPSEFSQGKLLKNAPWKNKNIKKIVATGIALNTWKQGHTLFYIRTLLNNLQEFEKQTNTSSFARVIIMHESTKKALDDYTRKILMTTWKILIPFLINRGSKIFENGFELIK